MLKERLAHVSRVSQGGGQSPEDMKRDTWKSRSV